MNLLDLVPLSLRMMVRGLVFLARMHASERRFQRYARRRAGHDRQAERDGLLMAAEVEYRVLLCRERGRPGWHLQRTASGVPAVIRRALVPASERMRGMPRGS